MVTLEVFRTLALSFPEASEEPHFEKTSFRIRKKIFASYDAANHIACLKLSETDQDLFSLPDNAIVYAVNNKWGRQGWTNVELKKVTGKVFAELLRTAYCEVAPEKLAAQVREV